MLLAIGRHFAWQPLPDEWQADAWNAMGAAAVLAGFGFAAWGAGPAVGLMLAVLGAHEAGVIACSVAYIIEPWPIPAGVGQCSAWAGWNVSKAFGLLLLLALVKIHSTEHVNNDRC